MRLAIVLTFLLLAAPAHACDAFVSGCGAATRAQNAQVHVARAPSRIVGRRPRGCPRRYCGCAISLKVFRRIIPRLNLAANWLAFPRTSPAPGMVAARRGHVMQLLAHVNGSRWRVYDPNSGGGKTRIHVRSLKGFAVVNPHARSVAELAK